MHRRAGRITALHEDIGLAMLRRQGANGRLDPSHATIANDAGASPRTVRRALASCGLLLWARRIVRIGLCAEQASNAYVLTLGDVSQIPAAHGKPTGGQRGRETLKQEFIPLPKVSQEERGAAQQWLAQVAGARMRVLGLT